MKALDLEKLIGTKGWYFVRQTGSHKIYKHETISGIIVIPFHGSKDLPKGAETKYFEKSKIKSNMKQLTAIIERNKDAFLHILKR
ncbi:MAG: type II toxin-antitoxin system HicA family toxin [Saprospiraceae bacterium]|nr:type II toxin-antitoxin system HicA family toxin [Saprospiraceae bacterium]